MRFKILVKYCFLTFCLWFLIHTIYISIDGIQNNYQVADVAVILGNKVNRDGTISNRLKSRLDCGLQLYKNKYISNIIVIGGYGKEGYFEGDKMREYLVNNGVPDSNIITDNKGNNTIQSVQNAIQLQQKYSFKSIIIVSQFYHISRTRMLFKKLGFNYIYNTSPAYYEWRDIYSTFREFFAFYEVYFFGIK